MEDTQVIFYKRPEINRLSNYNKYIEQNLEEGCDLIGRIMDGVQRNPRKDKNAFNYSHEKCGFTTDSRTEKRLCRCLTHYSTENPDCKDCKVKSNEFFGKVVEPTSARIIDFEIPVSINSKDGIGEIDILLEKEETYYCTEVKPIWNTETILRMVAEIVTYTEILKECNREAFEEKYKVSIDKCKKAILYMEGSKQEAQWNPEQGHKEKYRASKRLRAIVEKLDITVFCLKIKDGKYFIDKV